MRAAIAIVLVALCVTLVYGQEAGSPPSDESPFGSSPGPPDESQPEVAVAYFHNPACNKCVKAAELMRELPVALPWVTVEWFNFNDRDSLPAHALAMQALNIPQDDAPGPPLVVMGEDFLQGDDINRANLQMLLDKYQETGAVRVWDLDEQNRLRAEKIITERMQRYGLAGVIAAGLVDGVNPCAFATLVFFVSYLTFLGRGRRDVLVGGLGFAVGVFGAYLAVGLGATAVVKQAAAQTWMHHALYAGMAIIAFFFAVLSLLDYKKLREGRTADVALQLPPGLKRRIHSTIRERTRVSGLALGALIAGAVVSILELGCTGQIYLPTIVGVISIPALRSKAVVCLLLYNLAFVAPLLGVLAVTHTGVSSQRLAKAAERHSATAKLLMFLLFAVLACYFLYVLSTLSGQEAILTHGH